MSGCDNSSGCVSMVGGTEQNVTTEWLQTHKHKRTLFFPYPYVVDIASFARSSN